MNQMNFNFVRNIKPLAIGIHLIGESPALLQHLLYVQTTPLLVSSCIL